MKILQNTIISLTFMALAVLSASTSYALEYTKTLSQGDKGDTVTELQLCLETMGYELPTHGADGSFGKETFLAVSLFQKNHNLVADGTVGKKTAEAMDCKSPRERGEADIQDVEFSLGEGELIITMTGVTTNSCSSVEDDPNIDFVVDDAHFAITVQETLPYEDEVCKEVENEYKIETSIDTSELAPGDYTVVINGNDDFEYDFEIIQEKTDELALKQPVVSEKETTQKVVNNTSVSAVSSSYDMKKRDTAVFNFKMNLTPFEDPIYVPAVADAAVDVEVYTTKGAVVDEMKYALTVRTEAPKVTGVDGNVYYKVEKPEVFIYTAKATPGAGNYYAQLVNVSFTSQNVTKKSYTGFSGLTLKVDPKTWTTASIELGA